MGPEFFSERAEPGFVALRRRHTTMQYDGWYLNDWRIESKCLSRKMLRASHRANMGGALKANRRREPPGGAISQSVCHPAAYAAGSPFVIAPWQPDPAPAVQP